MDERVPRSAVPVSDTPTNEGILSWPWRSVNISDTYGNIQGSNIPRQDCAGTTLYYLVQGIVLHKWLGNILWGTSHAITRERYSFRQTKM